MSSQYQPASVYTSIDANVNDTSIFDMTNESSSESVSSSLTLLIIVISSAIFVTACIYIFLRCLSPPVSTRTHSISNSSNDRHVALKNGGGALHVNLLPLFKFGALSGNHTTTGDCAVCLSKFEREDQLRLLPQCRHAFHAECIDTWLKKNQTCPLCRSTVYPTDAVVPNNIRFDSVSDNPTDRRTGGNDNTNNDNYRIEIGNISTRRGEPHIAGEGRRSYSIGSFEYIVDRDYEVSVDSTLQRDASVTKEFAFETVTEQLSERLPAEASAAERSWLKEYVDWLAPFSLNSRTTSLRSSSRFFSGSVRRNDVIVPVQDLEANRVGEEISELFQWFSRV